MTCFHPISAFRSKGGQGPNGSWPIVFKAQNGITDKALQIPCGQCLGCRLDRARQWAIRCMHESVMHQDNIFLTLTYDNKHLKERCKKDDNGRYSLNKKDFVNFLKRFRKYYGTGIKFFHCGEYGERFQRPHHHSCVFGTSIPDKVPFSKQGKNILYISPQILKLWPFGFHSIGEFNWDTASYVAGYVTKKVTGEKAKFHYSGREPEYQTMSRNPGIGKTFIDKYTGDVYNYDKVVINGRSCRPPRYYDNIYDNINHEDLVKIKERRLIEVKILGAKELKQKEEYQKQMRKNHQRRLEKC